MSLHELGAIDALAAFRSREVSPVELFDALVARVARVDAEDLGEGAINAIAQMLEGARASAVRAERAYAMGVDAPLGVGETALLGIPIVAKEKHGIAGEPLSFGVAGLRDQLAPVDHPVIERIKAAGGVVHARATTPEFSCATVTHSPLWGVTRNPWSRAFSPGGSSGGSGAALAAGYAPLATASDIAGSTRIPAGFSGVVGYKAPYGRIPGMPPLSADWYRGDGPMARSVADTALLTNVMAGVHPIDHTTVPGRGAVAIEYPDAANWLPGKRVALAVRLGDYVVHSEVEEAIRRTAATLTAAGAEVSEVELPWTSERIREITMAHFGSILGPSMAQSKREAKLAGFADYTDRFIADTAAAAERMSLLESLTGEAQMQAELVAAMRDADVLIAPVNAIDGLMADASYLDGITVATPEGGEVHLGHYWQAHLTVPFNVNNRCPVLAIPIGVSGNGVPIGMQIVGHPYAEDSVFRLGAAIEALQPWPLLAPVH